MNPPQWPRNLFLFFAFVFLVAVLWAVLKYM